MATNINRDYLVVIDVKSGNINKPSMVFYNTDKNTSNIYAQLVVKETIVHATPIENATDFVVELKVIKPENIVKMMTGVLVNEAEAIYEFDLPVDFINVDGTYAIEFWVKAKVADREEVITSSRGKYTVKASILTDLDEAIEDHEDYPLFLKLMEEVKVINETAHELDTTIRTLQSDMIDANNEMKANEEQRKANEVLRETNEANRVAQENAREEYINAFDGKWEEYKTNTDTDIANYKAQINAQEVAREQAEATREANEQQRTANENDRIYKEDRRESQERDRVSNEYDRQNAEQSREYAEIDRVANEEIRQTNEANRETAEQIRRTNEQARITAETARVTEHEQMRTELNEVKAENAILMENDKKQADRMTQVEISDKRQYVIMEGLMNSAGDGYLKIEDTGNDTTLYNSVEGFVDVKNITGNTMVNSIKNPDDELTLNADINTSGQSVTLTTAVDNGQVDVLAEGNTMVNVCDQKDPVAITTDTNTFPLRYLYTSTEYTLQFESDTAVTIDITLGGYTLSSQNIVIGLNKINIITPNELTDNNLILNGTGFSASNIVVTEATDKDFGYFSGMKSVGELEENKIEILSRNKNLFDGELEHGYIRDASGTLLVIPNTGKSSKNFIPVCHGETYTLHFECDIGISTCIYCYDKNYNYLNQRFSLSISKTGNLIVTISNPEIKYIKFRLYSSSGKFNVDNFDNILNITLGVGSTAVDYVPHTENKKQILLNEPLRAVGDTKDRFVQIDGKWYVERNCGEVVLDGSENFSGTGNGSQYWIDYTANGIALSGDVVPVYSNTLPWYVRGIHDRTTDCIGLSGSGNIRIYKNGLTSVDAYKSWLQQNPTTAIYQLKTPTYEPVEISPVLNTYTDVTHITNNSTIPMNMPIVNSGYEVIAKPSTKYTVVGINNGRIGDSTIVNGTITTPATITDNFLRPYGTGTTSKVMLLEGEPANIPGYFKGIKSVFEDKVTEDGKYACEVRVYNDLGNETVQTLHLDEPLYNTNNITIYNDKLGYWKNWDKVVLDGSESWFEDGQEYHKNTKLFIFIKNDIIASNKLNNMYSNRFLAEGVYASDIEGFQIENKNNIRVSINKAKLLTQDVPGFKHYLSQNPVTVVYQLREPVFVPVIDNCPNWVISSWDNCSIHFDSIIPLKATRYRYTGNVPSVMAMSNDVAETKNISDEQDAMIVDLATQVATMEMMLM